ncbi:hypothetical protein RCJ22_22590 [Vibrio sp. FNV 38]|nr:hypothetical protein [Vibrio sp. FNV 38]
MKKTLTLLLASATLFGCQSIESNETQSTQQSEYSQSVSLKSALWFNKMPTIGDTPEFNLHGSLALQHKGGFPAEMEVTHVELHQVGEKYLISENQFELRNHNEAQWEVAFALPIQLEEQKPVDVLVYFVDGSKQNYVTEQGVMVEVVY